MTTNAKPKFRVGDQVQWTVDGITEHGTMTEVKENAYYAVSFLLDAEHKPHRYIPENELSPWQTKV